MRLLPICVLSFVFSLASTSCSTTMPNVSNLTSQSLEIFDGLPTKNKSYLDRIEFERTHITEGVISDYIEIIEYLAARHDLKQNMSIPTPFFPRAETYPQVVLFYKGRYKIDKSNPKTHPSEWCILECEAILLGGHAESVLRVEIDVETLKAVPESIRKFQKTISCDIESTLERGPFGTHPCLKMSSPNNGAETLAQDGLYVYSDQVSPLWPDVFFIDGNKLVQDAGIHAVVYHRPIEAFNHLEHIRAYSSNNSDHRVIVEKRDGRADKTSMLIDYIDISITPRLPKEIIDYLIIETVGEKYFSDVYPVSYTHLTLPTIYSV